MYRAGVGILTALLIVGLAGRALATPPQYDIIDTRDLIPGAVDIYDINSTGQMLGRNATGLFIWTPDTPNGLTGHRTDLVGLPNILTAANVTGFELNDAGQILARREDALGGLPFLWTPSAPGSSSGTVTEFPKRLSGDLYSVDYLSHRARLNNHG